VSSKYLKAEINFKYPPQETY